MKQIVIILTAVLLLVGCKSTRRLEKTDYPTRPHITETDGKHAAKHAAAAYAARVAESKLNKTCVTATAKVSVTGIGKNLSVNGALRMKRDDVIRLSLRFLGMEVGLLEFTPQDVLVVDRMNKQYVRASYSEVGFLSQANLDFYSLQALFWNELFVPGEREVQFNLQRFHLSQSGNYSLLSLIDTPKLAYTFYTQSSTALIEDLTVKGKQVTDRGEFRWHYGEFRHFCGRSYPTVMQMQVSGTGKKDIGLSLRLSGLKTDSDWNTRTTVSSKYTRRSVEEVFKGLNL